MIADSSKPNKLRNVNTIRSTIHIPFNTVSGSHFYGKPIYCVFKKADICYAILDILLNKYDIYFNLLDIYYKEDILYSKYHINLIILDIQNVNIRYSQC